MDTSKAEIITIGDEILYGQILDTNSRWMSQQLDKAGIRTIRKTTVSDSREDILAAFKEAEQRASIVLITGGLGPTNDDLTKPCLSAFFDSELAINEQALRELTTFFSQKGVEVTEVNRRQAMLPLCCDVVSNKLGTAAGIWIEKNGKVFVSMPGVPHEMKRMMTDTVIPRLQKKFQPEVIHHRIIKTVGIGESWLADVIKNWEDSLPGHIKLAYLPGIGQVKLRLSGFGPSLETLKAEVQAQIDELHKYAGKYIFGYDEDTIEEVVGRLLMEQKKKIALAESCTGGYVSHRITSIPGSSGYFQGAVIPYQNDLKTAILGVEESVINQYGAVSEQTVDQMANLVRQKFKADVGLATSGIAGPGGGTPEKPVGTVWIAYADGEQTITRKLQLWKDRKVNIQATTVALLNLVRISLMKSVEIK